MIELSTQQGSLQVRMAQITDIGGRPSNEDAYGKAVTDNLACFVVADGAGGHAGGDVAAHLAVTSALNAFKDDTAFGHHALRSYVEHASETVRVRKASQPDLHDMSTTIAALLIDLDNACAVWAHLGDTRVYHFRDDKLLTVTHDHSVIQRFVDAGLCEPSAVLTHPQRNILYAAIGSEGDTDFVVHPNIESIGPRDRFLICTDGLWAYLPDSVMAASLVCEHVDEWLAWLCDHAAQAAQDTRKRDNYTAIAITFAPSGQSTAHGDRP